jgi:processive 1,2-diacylglycerol beta-glucosyltransferase
MECVAARKPMIINKIIPGQEEGNAEFVERFNLGLVASKPVDIASACQIILSRIDEYEERLAQHARPHAARDILSYIATRLDTHDKS